MTLFEPFAYSELEQSIPARFARQVALHGAREAVRSPERSLTFAALDALSNGIATELCERLGPEPGPVPLVFDQGAELVAAILATLKAGKFYVCVDPDDSAERSRAVLTHAGATGILTRRRHLERCRHWAPPGLALIDVDESSPRVTFQPARPVGPDHLAYLFYTSGSTGAPKGVFDSHRNVTHNVMRYTNNLRIGPEDRLTLLQSSTFSATVSSLFCGLLNGACLLAIPVAKAGIAHTARWLQTERATVYHSVPALFEQMLGMDRRFPTWRVIRLEGDLCAPRHVRLYRERFEPSCLLAVGLGATETGLSRQLIIDAQTTLRDDVVPIGHATADMEILIVDDHRHPLPAGSIGEIAVRSRYLALGYWKDVDRTRAAFRADPEDPHLRTYYSGDVGRLGADDCLEYLGRRDFQIKIRGMSVSLPAVEAALSALADVRECVVMPDVRGASPRLAAYVVPRDAAVIDVGGWRRALTMRLHPAMIPASFTLLPALPLDANGKVDRRALPAPAGERPPLVTPYAAPVTSDQIRMARRWCEVLELDRVGIHDDFFELGGDSLLATALLDLVHRDFGVCLPHAVWLEVPTVSGLLAACDQQVARGCLVRLHTGGHKAPFFCVHAHSGQVLEFAHLARNFDPQRPMYGLQARGLDGTRNLPASIDAMAQAYVEEVLQQQPAGPYHLGGWCMGALIALQMATLLRARGEHVALVALIDPDPAPVGPPVHRPTQAHTPLAASTPGVPQANAVRNLVRRLRELLAHGPATLRARVVRTLWRMIGFRRDWLPRALAASCIDALHQHATARYQIRVYDGAALLLISRGQRERSLPHARHWDRWLQGALQVEPLDCFNNEILVEPQVRTLAQRLCLALDAAGSHRKAEQSP